MGGVDFERKGFHGNDEGDCGDDEVRFGMIFNSIELILRCRLHII